MLTPIIECLKVGMEIGVIVVVIKGFRLKRTNLYMVWIVVSTLQIPSPSGTGAGSTLLLNVILLFTIDKEVTVTITVGINSFISVGVGRHICYSGQKVVGTIFLTEVVTDMEFQQVQRSLFQVHPIAYIVSDVNLSIRNSSNFNCVIRI